MAQGKIVVTPLLTHWAPIQYKDIYRKSHCGDKTILRPSYLHSRISYTGKTTSLYWAGALELLQSCTKPST